MFCGGRGGRKMHFATNVKSAVLFWNIPSRDRPYYLRQTFTLKKKSPFRQSCYRPPRQSLDWFPEELAALKAEGKRNVE